MRRALLAAGYCAILFAIVWFADHEQFHFIFAWIRAIPGGDYVCHFLLVGGLAFVLNWALRGRKVRCAGCGWLLGSVIAFVLFTGEECSQIWLPGRTFDLLDLAANWAGVWCFDRVARRVLAREGKPPPN